MDSGIENMEVDENDRREKRSLSDKVGKRKPCFCFSTGDMTQGNSAHVSYLRSLLRVATQSAGPGQVIGFSF